MRKEILTKSGYRTHIDQHEIFVNGKKQKVVWGITKARQYANGYANNLFSRKNNKVEIVNCYTGEVTHIS